MKIQKIRKALNMTQADLAQACGTSQQQIAKIEGGVVDPRLSTLRRVADALHCELAELFLTRHEFLFEIEDVVRQFQLDLSKIRLISLNQLCSDEGRIPTFHPFWEKIEIVNGKVTLM